MLHQSAIEGYFAQQEDLLVEAVSRLVRIDSTLGPAQPGKLYVSEFEFDPSLLGEGQYFFYLDIFDGALAQAVCLDKPVTEFAFEVTSGDLSMPEWASGWGRIHFPPVKVLTSGAEG